MLTFKESPDYEMPGDMARDDDPDTLDVNEEETVDNDYKVTVVAIEMLAAGQDPPARRSELEVTVTVDNVDEDGSISLNRLQTRVGVTNGVEASLTDPDGPDGGTGTAITAGVTWLWSIPKVSRPLTETDEHWTFAGGGSATTTYNESHSPTAADVDMILRVKATYTDAHGAMKTAYATTAHPVAPDLAGATNNASTFDETTVTFMVPEDAAVGTVVGTVRATDGDSADILSHELTGTDSTSFDIDIATGEITLAAKLDHERETGGNENYSVTITAYDPSNVPSATPATVTITATDVNEAPGVALEDGVTEVLEVDENHDVTVPETGNDDSVVLGQYDPTDPDAGDDPTGDDAPELSLGGDDAGAFTLDEDDGQLRFTATPDYESPTDANMDSVYKVSIVATDDESLTGKRDLSIKVVNVNEDGTLKVSPDQPGINVALDATLTDEDGGITGAKWQWHAMDTKPTLPLTDGNDDGDSISRRAACRHR